MKRSMKQKASDTKDNIKDSGENLMDDAGDKFGDAKKAAGRKGRDIKRKLT